MDVMDTKVIFSNFTDLRTDKSVFAPIVTYGSDEWNDFCGKQHRN